MTRHEELTGRRLYWVENRVRLYTMSGHSAMVLCRTRKEYVRERISRIQYLDVGAWSA